MQLRLIASAAVLQAMFFCNAQSETIVAASYKDVCKKMEQEGATSRTQSGDNAADIAANVVVVVGAGHSASRRRNDPVEHSDIIIAAQVTQISTHSDVPDGKPASANLAANTCE